MKTLHKLCLIVLLAISALLLAPTVGAQGISIEIGDRPYYTHGASYWDGGVEYYWVPGHRGRHHRWVRGHYVGRGSRGPSLHINTRHHRSLHRAIFGR
ncbi:MAG TPA: hypothetical protein VK474_05675 [Chthoniobacterales bacterium]|nr:hypothetical protein [Chthoniobacterales bacterium]